MHLRVVVLGHRRLAEQVETHCPASCVPLLRERSLLSPNSRPARRRKHGQHGNRDSCLSSHHLRLDPGFVNSAYRLLEGVLRRWDGDHHSHLLVQPVENMCD